MNTRKNVHLFCIDPQEDFCNPKGALYVTGAEKDMDRAAEMIERNAARITKIHVSLDSHHLVDVAHPIFWRNSKGAHPTPFTIISKDDVKNGVWSPRDPGLTQRMIDYTEALDAGGRYPLCIWPPHCLIGSWGASVHNRFLAATHAWESQYRMVNFVAKGSNPYTEHYGVVKAEVVDPSDPGTQLNMDLINALMQADLILIMGEASSHCVANTVRDVADGFGNDDYVKKMVFVENASSPVPGFQNLHDNFIKTMTARGMQIARTTDVF